MAASISSSIVACLRAFNEFIEEIKDPDKEKPEGLYVQTWKDELGRLRIWAANIGAHQTGQSSLDFRLRDSSRIRQQMIKLLDEVLQRLQDVRDVILEGQDEDVESLDESSSENDVPQSELQQLRGSVATLINCLFEMSMLVRKPAPHDLRIGSKEVDVAAFEPFDYSHVRDKHPKADERIVFRLSQAITRRRKYLKYRERHAMKLKQGIDHQTSGSVVLSETVATDVQNRNVDFDDEASESGSSQTSYAPTLMSGGDITIPAPPRASQGGAPFECPYCYFIITVQSTRSWNRHVFNDLEPYVCTEITCTTPDKLYATRHEWLRHLEVAHPREESSRTKLGNPDQGVNCSLCGDSLDTKTRHDRHLARHLQELALFILPRNEEDSDDGEDNTDTDSSSSIALSARDHVRDKLDGSLLDEPIVGTADGGKVTDDTEPPLNVARAGLKKILENAKEGKHDHDQLEKTKKKKEDALKKWVIEEYNVLKLEKEPKKKAEKEAADKAFKDRVRSTFGAAGYDDESINKILEKEGKGNHDHGQKGIMDLTRPTYIKVHRKHLSPDTLDVYELPWEWDEVSRFSSRVWPRIEG